MLNYTDAIVNGAMYEEEFEEYQELEEGLAKKFMKGDAWKAMD